MKPKMLWMVLAGLLVWLAVPAWADCERAPEPKDVPELLTAKDGRKIGTAADWEAIRRPEIARIMAEEVFGVRPVERPDGRSGTEWGILSAWAWGASRVMDWLESEPSVDARHVGVVGLSRNGKAALVAGATDTPIWVHGVRGRILVDYALKGI